MSSEELFETAVELGSEEKGRRLSGGKNETFNECVSGAQKAFWCFVILQVEIQDAPGLEMRSGHVGSSTVDSRSRLIFATVARGTHVVCTVHCAQAGVDQSQSNARCTAISSSLEPAHQLFSSDV